MRRRAARGKLRATLRPTLFAVAACLVACARPDQPSKPSATDSPLNAPPTASSLAVSTKQAKPQTAEACKASCNGEWAAHGLAGVVSCLCRTKDSGRDCLDKSECQGECVLEPVRTKVVSPGPPTTGYFVGKCSEFVTVFGCARRIRAGTKEQPPADLSEAPPQICLD